MSTEIATITGARRDKVQKTGEGFIDVEVTFERDKSKEVLHFGYPLGTSAKSIEKDIRKQLESRQAERTQAKKQAEIDEASKKASRDEAVADKTVAALEGIKVK